MVRRLIKKADIKRVALCRRGANGMSTLFKSATGTMLEAMVKSSATFDERGELICVVGLPPGQGDLDGDAFSDEASLQGAAYAFMRNGAQLDIEHDGQALTKSQAYVAESFLIQPGDPRYAGWKDYAGQSVDVTGGWGAIIKIESAELRKAYRDGAWDGVSMYAPEALFSTTKSADTLRDTIRAELSKAGLIDDGDDDVKPEDLKTAVAEAIKPMGEAIATLVKTLTPKGDPDKDKPKDKPEEKAPEFTGDPTSAADLEKHSKALEAFELRKSGALNDPAKLAELLAAAKAKIVDPKVAREELRKSNPTLAAALDAKDAADVEIARLSKASNIPPTDGKPTPVPTESVHALLKSQQAQTDMAAGRAAAKAINDEMQRASPFAAAK